jgi:hypothetical protein
MKITDEQIARYPFLAVFRYYGEDEVTREAYLETTYLGHPPDVIGSELEAELPPELRENYEGDIDSEE